MSVICRVRGDLHFITGAISRNSNIWFPETKEVFESQSNCWMSWQCVLGTEFNETLPNYRLIPHSSVIKCRLERNEGIALFVIKVWKVGYIFSSNHKWFRTINMECQGHRFLSLSAHSSAARFREHDFSLLLSLNIFWLFDLCYKIEFRDNCFQIAFQLEWIFLKSFPFDWE